MQQIVQSMAPIVFCCCGIHGGRREVQHSMNMSPCGPKLVPLVNEASAVDLTQLPQKAPFLRLPLMLYFTLTYLSSYFQSYIIVILIKLKLQHLSLTSWRILFTLGKYLLTSGEHLKNITMSAHRNYFMMFLIFHVLKSVEFINVF